MTFMYATTTVGVRIFARTNFPLSNLLLGYALKITYLQSSAMTLVMSIVFSCSYGYLAVK